MDLKHLTGNELEKSTIHAVSMDRKATAVVLAHVKEVNNQKHYSSLGYRSAYDYLTRKHGYCAGSADRLIKAAAIIAVVPQAEVKLAQGEINLTALAAVQKFVKDNEISDTKEKAQILEKIQGKTKDETEKILFGLLPEDKKEKAPKDTKIRISDKEVRMSITVKDELISKIQRFKSLSGKNLENGEIFELAMDLLLEKEEHRKFKKLKNSPPAEKIKNSKVTINEDSRQNISLKQNNKTSRTAEEFRKRALCKSRV